MLSKWLADFDYERAKSRFKENLLRRNKYSKSSKLVNTLLETVCEGKIDNTWDQLYDAFMHVNALYVDKLESTVNLQ